MKRILYAAPTVLCALFFTSCDRDETIEEIDNSGLDQELLLEKLYAFHNDITINSEEGSEAVVRVFSNSKEDVNAYTKANITLLEIDTDESLKQSLARHHMMDLTENKSEAEHKDVSDNNFDTSSDIGFQLVRVTKNRNGVRYALSFDHPETNSTNAPWRYYTHYSTPNQEKIAEIARHSFWRRVYYGLKYKANSGSSWNTIQNEWKLVKNNESFSHTKNPCYQFRMRVKTKMSSAYSVTFDY